MNKVQLLLKQFSNISIDKPNISSSFFSGLLLSLCGLKHRNGLQILKQ